MADKIPENAGPETGNVTPEQLVEAMKLVGDFAKKNPEAALRLVRESLANGGTTPWAVTGISRPSITAPIGTASF